jgi:hypothetical protein
MIRKGVEDFLDSSLGREYAFVQLVPTQRAIKEVWIGQPEFEDRFFLRHNQSLRRTAQSCHPVKIQTAPLPILAMSTSEVKML